MVSYLALPSLFHCRAFLTLLIVMGCDWIPIRVMGAFLSNSVPDTTVRYIRTEPISLYSSSSSYHHNRRQGRHSRRDHVTNDHGMKRQERWNWSTPLPSSTLTWLSRTGSHPSRKRRSLWSTAQSWTRSSESQSSNPSSMNYLSSSLPTNTIRLSVDNYDDDDDDDSINNNDDDIKPRQLQQPTLMSTSSQSDHETKRMAPPYTRELIDRITQQYQYSTMGPSMRYIYRDDVVDDSFVTTTTDRWNVKEEFACDFKIKDNLIPMALDEEYEIHDDVPVELDQRPVSLPKAQRKTEQYFAQLLSFAALNHLPREMTMVLLRATGLDHSVMEPYVNLFELGGWDSVRFPRGLALSVKDQYQSSSSSSSSSPLVWTRQHPKTKNIWYRHWNRRQYRNERIMQAQAAIQASKLATVPLSLQRMQQNRQDLLAKIEAELLDTTFVKAKERLLFFPKTESLESFSFQQLRRIFKNKYSQLKNKGRAGVLAYCFFNFLFYSTGFLWQWPRIALGDPLTVTTSSLLRKGGRVFASLYLAAQIVKLPKIIAAIAITPHTQKALDMVSRKMKVGETAAFVICVSVLLFTWVLLCGVPVLADFVKIRNLVLLDEQLLNMYSLHPV